MVWKLRKSCFHGPNIDDCKVSSRIHSCIYASISLLTKIVMKKENLCKLLFFLHAQWYSCTMHTCS